MERSAALKKLSNQRLIIAVFCAVTMMVTIFYPGTTCAQDILERMEIPSSPNPVGSGARALGMGGAFISIADDATAASWNPGALIQLEKPEFSIVVSHVSRTEDNTFGSAPEASGEQSVNLTSLNYLSAAYPFTAAGRNMVVSLNYQHLYDFDREWNFVLNSDDPVFTSPISYQYEQDGGLYALGLAYSVQIHPTFSVGVTLNYWGDGINNQWEQKYRQSWQVDLGGILGNIISAKQDEYEFDGWNANLGFLWHLTSKLTLGGVIKTPFDADIHHKLTLENESVFPMMPAADSRTRSTETFDEELSMPLSYGLGVSYRFNDAFTLAADVYRTQWDDFEYKDSQGNTSSPITGGSAGDVDPTTWIRAGGEYLFIGNQYTIPVRAGIFYDPAPQQGSPDDIYGFSLGSGFVWYDKFSFDVAYQYRFGSDLGTGTLTGVEFSQDLSEHTIYGSVIVYF